VPERSGDLRKDTQALTQRLAWEFEGLIAAAPTQWHMLSPYFRGPEGAAEPHNGPAGRWSGPVTSEGPA
jgi:lauroyl/myristoyl acyltransferase